MEVDKQETSTSASTVTDPLEGSSNTSERQTPGSSQSTVAIKSDLNSPWFVHFQTNNKL